MDYQTLWKLLRHCRILEKITNIIRRDDLHGQQLTDPPEVRTGGRQGCLLLLVMFLLTMDWVTKTCTTY